MTVRAFFQAAKVESAESPYDRIYLKILYPAQMSGSHTGKIWQLCLLIAKKPPFLW